MSSTNKSMRDQVAETLATIPDNPPKPITVYIYDLDLYRFYALYSKLEGRDRSRLIQTAMGDYVRDLIATDPDAKRIWEMAVQLGGDEDGSSS